MYQARNDISKVAEAGIPVELTEFSCGCWGKHNPPHVDPESGKILVAVGQGYRSNKHLHGQNLYMIEVDAENRVALVEMRKYGDLYGSGMWHYLIGVDEVPFVAQVPNTLDTLKEALDYLKPAVVKRAEEAGLAVQRQGDWYFVPVARTPRGEVTHDQPLDDDHVATDIIRKKSVIYVRGMMTHGRHTHLELDGWHKAIQNKAIRTGRLTRGGGAD